MYGNKPSQIPAIPTTSSFAKANGQNMRHYFGNCATSSGCTGCLNNKLVTVGTDFQTFSLGNNCNSDLDKDQSWTELTCIFEKSQIENLHSTWRSSRRLDEKVEAKKEHKAVSMILADCDMSVTAYAHPNHSRPRAGRCAPVIWLYRQHQRV